MEGKTREPQQMRETCIRATVYDKAWGERIAEHNEGID